MMVMMLVVMIVMVMVLMLIVVIVIIVVVVMVLMLVVIVIIVVMVVVVMFMFVVVIIIVIVVVMMLVLVVIVVIVVVIVVMSALFAVTVLIVLVMMVSVLQFVLFSFEERCSHVCRSKRLFDSLKDLYSGEVIPGCCDDLCVIVDLADESYCLIELILSDIACTAQDDRSCILDLVLIELLEVLEVDAALGSVDNCNCSADLCSFDALNGSNYVGELAYAGRFDEDPVGSELVDYVLQGCAEVADKAAADTA